MRYSSNEEIITKSSHKPWKVSAAVREGCRIIATSFLSLLLPLSFLLLARLSTSRYFKSIENNHSPHNNSFFLNKSTTLILSTLVFLTTIAAFANVLTAGGKASIFNILSQRVRFYGCWVLLFLMQVCLCLGILGGSTVEEQGISGYTVGRCVLLRRVFLVVGLCESMVLWWRSVVKPVVVEETFCDLEKWVEKLVMMVGFGNLWWRRLREEAEVLVVLPWVMTEDVVGWLLYYLTVAIGVVRVVRGLAWFITTGIIFRYWKKV